MVFTKMLAAFFSSITFHIRYDCAFFSVHIYFYGFPWNQSEFTLYLKWKGVEPATTYQNLGLPDEWYGALEWIFPNWARAHALDKGEAVNILKGAIVTADRVMTVSPVIVTLYC